MHVRSLFTCIIALVFGGNAIISQTFPGQGGLPVPPGAPTQTVGITTSIATVSGIGIIGQGCTEIDNVTIDFSHTFVGDVAIFLISPAGDVLEFSSGNGGAGDNFTNSVFTDNTPLFITQGMPPYTGTWRPEGRQQNTTPPFPNTNPLGTFTFANTFNGTNADGDWTLFINDYIAADVGTLHSWSITFTAGGGPVPTVDLGPDITICPGETVTLTADVTPGADSYQWSTGQTTSSINVSPVTTTQYMVTVTHNGCTDKDTINVHVDPNAVTADAGPDVNICEGASATLTGSGGGPGATYTWSTGQSGASITVSPSGTTTYTLTVTDGMCTSSDQVTVTVTPEPVADAGLPETICEGENITITATGGSQNNQYTWSTGQTGASITVGPSMTTVYTVTVNVNGCTSTDDVTVTVVPLPIVDAGTDLVICTGESAVLTASGTGGVFTWSTGQSGAQITVNPLTTTLYTVTLSDNGCIAVDEVFVEVFDVLAAVTPDETICEGMSITLVATGGIEYQWSTGQQGSSITVSPAVTTLYTVTVSLGACFDIASVLISVSPVPVPTVSPDEDICAGETITLTASGGVTYLWSNGQQGPSIQVSPVTSTTYTVTVTEQVCSATADVHITVHPAPAADAGPDINLCEGESATLVATGLSGQGTYTWSTGETGATIVVFPAVTTTYTVSATSAFGCEDSDEVTVFVHAYPVADAGPNVFILPGENATLTATGGGTYQWSTGEVTATITVSPTVTTVYTVTVTIDGCSVTDEVTVFVNEPPFVNLGPDVVICLGESVTLDATIPGPFTIGYIWSTGENTPGITVSPPASSWYSVTVTDLVSDFSSVDSIFITVNTLPLGPVVIQGETVLCSGDTAAYFTAPVTGATMYQWSISAEGSILSGQNTTGVTVIWNTVPGGTITLIVSNDCGALPAEQLTVEINGPPALPGPVGGPANPCHIGIYTYSVPVIADATSYQWTLTGGGALLSGQGTTSVTIDWTGTSGGDICVVAGNDCGDSEQACLTVVTTQTPGIDAGQDMAVCGFTASMNGSGAGEWSLVMGPGGVSFTDPNDPLSEVQVSAPGAYTFLYAIDENGCMAEDEVVVTFNDIPAISGVDEVCSADLLTYAVTFQITGGTQPWQVSGGVTTGNQFVSDPVAAGSPYSFQVTDANGCISEIIIGQQDCACITRSGNMNPGMLQTCIGRDILAMYLGGEVTDPDDVTAFVLHDGNIPGGIIAWNTAPVFGFQPGMITGVTYYISAVAGTGGAGAFPDPADPCFSVSQGTPVVFHDPPLALLQDHLKIDCDPQELVITAGASSSGQDFRYVWSAIDGGVISGPANDAEILAIAPGTYILTVEQIATLCTAADTVVVAPEIFSLAGLDISIVPPSCPGECDGQVEIAGVQQGLEFDFGDGHFVADPLFTGACSGGFTLSVKGANGCVADTVFLVPVPEALTVSLGPDHVIDYGNSVLLNAASSHDILFYDWLNAGPCTTCQSLTVTPLTTTRYQVEVEDHRGCKASDDVLITVRIRRDIYFPNVFSPNDDGINDYVFISEGPAIAYVNRFEIFDRWGNMVFQRRDFIPGDERDGWGGIFREKPVPPGVYVCLVEYRDINQEVFHHVWDVTLVR